MTNSTHLQPIQTCPICSVDIVVGGKVQFSNGYLGTRAQLYARVCQYAHKSGCINQDKERIGTIMLEDGFSSDLVT